ncbi:DoxX family membrane protein [Corynebacterium sp.]|uniref:DoxX family membrane protein n=1 Tax=Corynebacterium sp. TaxID=1720 RepID=UPI003B3B0EEB
MSISTTILRSLSGAYFLQSGIGKLKMPTEAAAGLQQFAATGVPQVAKLDPDTFSKVVSYSEIGVGASLLTPFVSNRLAGLALGAINTGFLSIYFRNEQMTRKDGIRPSEAGTGLSKDLFIAAIAGALIAAPTKPKK